MEKSIGSKIQFIYFGAAGFYVARRPKPQELGT